MLTGGVDTGWTFYTPYSTAFTNTKIIEAGLAAFVAGFSSIFTGLNFIVTVHRMRAPGMTWGRLPLFIWANYATSIIMILGTPVIAITIILVAAGGRLLHIRCTDPKLGGDPLLFQHLFWFYSHPAVYIMILPSMGVISEIIHGVLAQAHIRVQICGIVVDRNRHHRLPGVGASHVCFRHVPLCGLDFFSFLTYLVGVPSAIKVFNWTATLYKGSISYTTPMLYALGFIGLFLIGGLTGLFLASLGIDVHVTDTYFVVAHFHYVMVGSVLMAYLGGMHFWWAKDSGRMYPEGWGRLAAFDRIHRLQSHILPAVRVGLPRDATPLLAVQERISGVEHLFDRWGHHPGRGIPFYP